MKTKYVLTAILIGLFTITSVKAQEKTQSDDKSMNMDKKHVESEHDNMSQTTYSCPMQCEGEKTYNKAGKCPKCGMNLTKVEMEHDKMTKSYICTMHPEVKSDQPGKCSNCGMALVEKKADKKMENDHKGHMH